MRIAIVVAAYISSYVGDLIDSALYDDVHDVELWVYTHSKHEPMTSMIEERLDGNPIRYFPYKTNRGLALSWNDGMFGAYDNGADLVIISNDDIIFSRGDIDKMAKKARACPRNYMISAAGWHDYCHEDRPSQGYSCFAVNPIALEKIGAFDQNFYPAYFEDLDHHRRATMLGLVEENCPDTQVMHGGSQAITMDKELSIANMVTQRKNLNYFRLKWDSDSHIGGYKSPFNESKFGLYISPKDRFNPYSEYNRSDVPSIGGQNEILMPKV